MCLIKIIKIPVLVTIKKTAENYKTSPAVLNKVWDIIRSTNFSTRAHNAIVHMTLTIGSRHSTTTTVSALIYRKLALLYHSRNIRLRTESTVAVDRVFLKCLWCFLCCHNRLFNRIATGKKSIQYTLNTYKILIVISAYKYENRYFGDRER